jgi:glycosyltransferase involved in cell wall biosynthesis
MSCGRQPGVGRVSVIIPTYNRGGLLPRAIDSVLRQSAAGLCDIVVVDDGSTDDTAAVVARYGARVQYLRQANAGGAAARNTGICASDGEFVAFLDSDDYWLPEKTARQLAAFDAWPSVALVAGRATGFFADGECKQDPRPPVPAGRPVDFAPALFEENFLHTPAVMVRRRNLRVAGLFPVQQRRCHDYPLWVRLALTGPGVYLDCEVARFSASTPESLQSDRWAALYANYRARRLIARELPRRPTARAAWRRGFLRQAARLRDRAFQRGDYAMAVRLGVVVLRHGWTTRAGWEWRQLLVALGRAAVGSRGATEIGAQAGART